VKRENLHQREFGRLKVTGPPVSRNGQRYWPCKCKCGNTTLVTTCRLLSGKTRSCGCARSNPFVKRDNAIHGHTRNGKSSPTFSSWSGLIKRTTLPNPRYSDRGIRVCQHWRVFVNFLADMKERPSLKHSIDRKNNDGHYSCGHCEECVANGWPANCKWSTPIEQATNRDSTHFLTYNDLTLSLSEWSRRTGFSPQIIKYRLSIGLSIADALTRPLDRNQGGHHKRLITHNGITQTLKQWAESAGLKRATLAYRLTKMSMNEALERPLMTPAEASKLGILAQYGNSEQNG
jgi:hypothetical protein